MTLLTVVKDVCAAVGVAMPTSVFSGINSNRTQQELLALANETAQRIAYDTREWGLLKALGQFNGTQSVNDPAAEPGRSEFNLPADFKRFLLTSNLNYVNRPLVPLRFIPEQEDYLRDIYRNYHDFRGEWTVLGNSIISVMPRLPNSEAIWFVYLSKNCVVLNGGGFGEAFLADTDRFRLDERLLKLGMIWVWKQQKGSPYAEDMGTYETALAKLAGADKPAPIIIGRSPISQTARVAYPFDSSGWGPPL